MSTLTPGDRARLAKLLGLTGSSHDGEVLAAARKAQEFLKDKGTTWPQVLGLDAMPHQPAHVSLARELLVKGEGLCTRWEINFLREVATLQTLSDYQRLTLKGIREKVFPLFGIWGQD